MKQMKTGVASLDIPGCIIEINGSRGRGKKSSFGAAMAWASLRSECVSWHLFGLQLNLN